MRSTPSTPDCDRVRLRVAFLARWFASALILGVGVCEGVAQNYTFTTIAGKPGVSGHEDGPGGQALLNGPAGVALDAAGNLYVTEDGSHTVRKLVFSENQWTVTTIAGKAGESGSADGSGAECRFNRPRGLAIDGEGSLLVADYSNSTIRKLRPVGAGWECTTLAGSPGVLEYQDGVGTNAFFWRPTGVTASPNGWVFVADMNNYVLRQMEFTGEEWLVQTIAGYPGYSGWEDGIGDYGEFGAPFGVAASGDETVYVADAGNNNVRQVTLTGSGWSVTTIAGITNSPSGGTDGEGSLARFYFPAAVAVQNANALVVSDQLNHTLRSLKFDGAAWNVSTLAGLAGVSGTNDGPGLEARFQRPWGIAIGAGDVIYVADLRNHTIRRGVASGTVESPVIAFGVTGGELRLSWPGWAEGFVLEKTADLGGGWAAQTEGVSLVNGQFEYRQAVAGELWFFRLRQQ